MPGGVPAKEDFLPVLCLHQTMTAPHELADKAEAITDEAETNAEIEEDTLCGGRNEGGEFPGGAQTLNEQESKHPVHSTQQRQQRPSHNAIVRKTEGGDTPNLHRHESGVLLPIVIGRPSGARRSLHRPESDVLLLPTAIKRPPGARHSLLRPESGVLLPNGIEHGAVSVDPIAAPGCQPRSNRQTPGSVSVDLGLPSCCWLGSDGGAVTVNPRAASC